jgi:hypothetical protein
MARLKNPMVYKIVCGQCGYHVFSLKPRNSRPLTFINIDAECPQCDRKIDVEIREIIILV